MGYLISIDNPAIVNCLEMARHIEAKDSYTAGHTWRVANYAQILAAAMNYTPEQIENALWAGSLHDIGKIAVPDEILSKPGPLTDEEFEILKQHPENGYRMIKEIPELSGILNVVRLHHEAYDGSGYPFGLAGEAIPHEARLFSVVDAFDAMTTNRCYRPGMPADNAIYEIWRKRGQQFDPEIADVFIDLYRQELLNHILGFSDFGIKIGNCPVCGPVLEVQNDQRITDEIHCSGCGSQFVIRLGPGGTFQLNPSRESPTLTANAHTAP